MHLNRLIILRMVTFFVSLTLLSCASNESPSFTIDYEKYVLANGLEVILHEDHSDPIVAVATLMHVGSNREKPGKTRFAHFFEHMSFNDSENVPRGSNRKLIPELGGSRNGGTWSDATIYYEVVPKDAFEKIMWIDSDRFGYMINTVTDAALNREKQVVKNEKRQRNDNAPYGHTDAVKRANLYPSDHPYNWTVIGSLADLQSATLEDVKEFYERFYGANNATLIIAGDIDVPQTKKLVEQWFGEIRKGPIVEPLKPMPVSLSESKSLYHEDNFAKLPEIRISFPTVEQYHPDSYALSVLGDVLSDSKEAPLYLEIVEERKLAPNVNSNQNSSELAGDFTLRVRANAGTDLDDVKAALEAGLERFEKEGVSDDELRRIKAQMETSLYNGIGTILNKAFQLAIYNEFAGDPGYISVEAERTQAVTKEDVMDVYRRYIKDKHYVMTSFVPKGQVDLGVQNAEKAEVDEEKIVANNKNEQVSQGEEADYEKTITKHDRSEPPLGDLPLLSVPEVWTDKLANGVKVFGIENFEIPLVSFDLSIRGGHWLDPLEKSGVARLMSRLMMEGTKNRTPAELERAIGLLGANISISTSNEEIRFTANTLARNFDETFALLQEILLEPRWDEKEFARLKQELATQLKGREANPNSIAGVAFNKLLYGDKHILGVPLLGTLETTKDIELEDLKTFYADNVSPSVASFHIVGAINKESVLKELSKLASGWISQNLVFPEYNIAEKNANDRVFFIDVPKAKQSVIRVDRLALSAKDDDYNNVVFANQVLGGGAAGRLFQTLRIEKGYTYGAYSFFGNTEEISPFTAITSVRSNVTLPSLKILKDLIANYRATYTEDEMEITKNQIIKSNTRAFESVNAKLGMLRQMSKFGRPSDFIDQSQKELMDMNLSDFHYYIDGYITEKDMIYLVVGDAETQFSQISQLGYGKPIMLDIYGNRIN